MALPVSAAGTVRYVDDNTTGACHGTHLHSIQAAINASSPKDIVYVCRGTYHEELQIGVPGLTVQSLEYRKAKLVPPNASVHTSLVTLLADGVKFRGFKIEIQAGDPLPPPPVKPNASGGAGGGTLQCIGYEVVIAALGARDGVWGNHISTVGDATLSGQCGYGTGILFAGLPDVTPANFTKLGKEHSSAKRNYVRDFKLGGIVAEGVTSVRISRNQVRYVHQQDPFTCVPVNTITVNPSLTFPCQDPNINFAPLNGFFTESVGIGVFGSKADVNNNTIFSTLDFALLEGGQVPLFAGILTFSADPGSRITENVVTQVFLGIAVDPDFSFSGVRPTGVPPSPGSMDITFNRTNEGFVGIVVDSNDNYIAANRARLNFFFGIGTDTGSGNVFIQNDARYNAGFSGGYDCFDETGGGVGGGSEGTNNLWTEDLGLENTPQDICLDLAPF